MQCTSGPPLEMFGTNPGFSLQMFGPNRGQETRRSFVRGSKWGAGEGVAESQENRHLAELMACGTLAIAHFSYKLDCELDGRNWGLNDVLIILLIYLPVSKYQQETVIHCD